jgi:hypothetical protein
LVKSSRVGTEREGCHLGWVNKSIAPGVTSSRPGRRLPALLIPA